ncbi:hypothetical protein DRH29_02870 [candidate division Kazan bacterium]|uniref:Uncharacterized protein n=1 Tax=candidate division Kazan bacterium TaxID=2202143 RepID=A0A420ZCK6_UNCK3|nr:MAG: hypothetical protein DRH29_02870 [candidate division Kazan bacterium]
MNSSFVRYWNIYDHALYRQGIIADMGMVAVGFMEGQRLVPGIWVDDDLAVTPLSGNVKAEKEGYVRGYSLLAFRVRVWIR